jgi:uncharacterized membrane protein YdjX (TVP38/TMEM64 family)
MIGGGSAFLLGRYVARDYARKQKKGRLEKIDEWVTFNGFGFILSLKLILFANPALDYAAGLTTVKLRDYFLGSFIGYIPGVLFFSYIFKILAHTHTLREWLAIPFLWAMLLCRIAGGVLFIILTKKYSADRPQTTDDRPQTVVHRPSSMVPRHKEEM